MAASAPSCPQVDGRGMADDLLADSNGQMVGVPWKPPFRSRRDDGPQWIELSQSSLDSVRPGAVIRHRRRASIGERTVNPAYWITGPMAFTDFG